MKTYLTYPYISWNVDHFRGKSSICKVPSIGWNRMIAMWFSQLNGIYLLVKDHDEKVTCKLRTAKDTCTSNSSKPNFPMYFPENCSELNIEEISVASPYPCKNLNGYNLGRAYLRMMFKCHCLHVAATWHLSLAHLPCQRWTNAGKDSRVFLSPSKCKGGTGIQLGDGCTVAPFVFQVKAPFPRIRFTKQKSASSSTAR